MYGQSDHEVFHQGKKSGWTTRRQLESLSYPARVDLIQPICRLGFLSILGAVPFLATFTGLRYASWAQAAVKGDKH